MKKTIFSKLLLILMPIALVNAKSRNRLDLSPIGRRQTPGKGGSTEPWIETFSLNRRSSTGSTGVVSKEEIPERIINKHVFATSLAFITGFADVFAFRMSKSYANMMTGSSIQCMAALGELQLWRMLHYGSLVLCYSIGNIIYRAMVHYHKEQPKPHATARASATPLMLGLFILADYLFYSRTMGSSEERVGFVIPAALAFGVLNAASVDALHGTITFAMTGHISKIAQGISDRFFHPEPRKRRFRSVPKTSARVMGFFSLGVLMGTWLASSGGSRTVLMNASGMTLPSFLIEDIKVPIFTIAGLLSVILIQLYDQPFPLALWDIITSIKEIFRRQQKTGKDNERMDLSVNIFSPSTWAQ